VAVGATTPANWKAFCATLGLQHLENDARFAKVSDRRRNVEELVGLIEAVTATRTSDHWYRALEKVGVPCGVLNRLDQVLADEHVKARGVVREVAHTKLGKVRVTGSPVRFSRTPVRIERAGPLLGEHTREILAELGRTDVASLEREGVVGAVTARG
jgi:formyl-CoA transferase